MPKLLLKFSGMVLKDIPLDKPQITIGRKMDNDVVIDNLAVSGHHAQVIMENGTHFVEDTGSTNGTFLNDAKIAKQRLQPGDQIRVGKHILVYEDETATAKPKPAPAVSLDSPRQGIVHVIGPELGLTQPGQVIVCGDSHTATHGAFGALAFGIGTSEVEHVLATQCLVQAKPKTLQVHVRGRLPGGATAKDLILALIGAIGTGGAAGHVIEYTGEAIEALSMQGRMTVCNMSIEAGAKAGMIAPDETTFAWLAGRERAPAGAAWDAAVARWRDLRTDPGARYDLRVELDASAIEPQVTWGTTPGMVIPVTGRVPSPDRARDAAERDAWIRALQYMGLVAGAPIAGTPVDRVFIGSCTNGRIEDLAAVAALVRGRRVADGVRAMVVPGSQLVKGQAEAFGIAEVVRRAGFEWRNSGCSMCLGMNEDILGPGERCASTSNRNFEGRQGRLGRTHLMSPAMAAAAAIAGRIVDVRAPEWSPR